MSLATKLVEFFGQNDQLPFPITYNLVVSEIQNLATLSRHLCIVHSVQSVYLDDLVCFRHPKIYENEIGSVIVCPLASSIDETSTAA